MRIFRSHSDFDERKDEFGFTDKFYDRLAAGVVIAALIIVICLIRAR